MRKLYLISILLFIYLNLYSFSLAPLSLDINTNNRTKSFFTVSNPKKVPIGIVIEIQTRDISSFGEEINDISTEDFIYFPKQFVLMPGQEKIVKLQYMKKTPLKEKAYRFIATEVPIKKDGSESGLIVSMKYKASIYVLPKKQKREDLFFENYKLTNGKKTILTIQNRGNIHELLKNYNLIFIDMNRKETKFDCKTIIEGSGNILPDNKRLFEIDNEFLYNFLENNHGSKTLLKRK